MDTCCLINSISAIDSNHIAVLMHSLINSLPIVMFDTLISSA